MTVTPKQLENLKKGAATRFVAGERQVEIAKKGKAASDKVKAEKKAKALEREEIVQVLTLVFNAPVDEKTSKTLESLGLPKTVLAKTLYNAAQKSGVNSNMLRVLLELINALKQQEVNVTVNNHSPYTQFSDEELRRIANDTDDYE